MRAVEIDWTFEIGCRNFASFVDWSVFNSARDRELRMQIFGRIVRRCLNRLQTYTHKFTRVETRRALPLSVHTGGNGTVVTVVKYRQWSTF